MRRVILIPSRYNSSRLFGKALLPLLGIPLVVHTYRRAEKSKLKNEIYLCTDSNKIIDVCKKYNLNYLKTSSKPKSGTDRIAEAAKKLNFREPGGRGGAIPLFFITLAKKEKMSIRGNRAGGKPSPKHQPRVP